MTNIVQQLKKRGCVHDASHIEELETTLNTEKISFYCGFDPTSDSLHVGSMLPLILMRRFQELGHTPIVLLGSATGMIGDPSGKSQERVLLDEETIAINAQAIEKQVRLFLDFDGPNKACIVSNHEWLSTLKFIEFLRDIGKHFSVGAMTAKDSVRSRLENREQGISYTEFSYMLLQAYDFYWLNKNNNCRLQVGGSDQWGNITAGLDLIRKLGSENQAASFGLTFPLLTTSTGAKFGKTEKGAVWLNRDKTSPYHFYQYWFNLSDQDACTFLRYFSGRSLDEIDKITSAHANAPQERLTQTELATELCTLIHGKEETQNAIYASEVLFKKSFKEVSSSLLLDIFQDIPSTDISSAQAKEGVPLPELLVSCGASSSKGQARKLIEGGGIYINNTRTADPKQKISISDFVDETVLVVRSGKKNYYLLRIT